MRHKIVLLALTLLVLFICEKNVLSNSKKILSTLILTNGELSLQEPFVEDLRFILTARFGQLAHIHNLQDRQSLPNLASYDRIIYYGLDSRVQIANDLIGKLVGWLKGSKNRFLVWLGYAGHSFDFKPWGFEVNQHQITSSTSKMYYYGLNNRLLIFDLTNQDVFSVNVLNSEKVRIEALIETYNASLPIIVTGSPPPNTNWGQVMYVGYHPTAYAGKLSGLIPFIDLLHGLYPYVHNRKLLFLRLEDWHPYADTAKFKAVVDYLKSQGIFYTLAVIPAYAENDKILATLETEGIKEKLYSIVAIPYASAVLHGYTHQLTGVTAVDYEFCDIKTNTYLSIEQARERMIKAKALVGKASLFGIIAGWETPHYCASPQVYREVFEKEFGFIFETCNQNRLCEFLPYYLKFGQSAYLNTLLGYVTNPTKESISEIVSYAQMLSKLRYGVEVGLFYHPDIFGLEPLVSLIEKLKGQGWETINLFTLLNY